MMQFLPVSNAILISGGRNDEMCSMNITPFLNDIHMFLLDQKVWIHVQYSNQSEKLSFICNSSMAVVSDGESSEKIVIFGGI